MTMVGCLTHWTVLLHLVVFWNPSNRVWAFPNRAGTCVGGRPAVDGSHIDYAGGTRLVDSGELVQYLELYVDNSAIASNFATISASSNNMHVIEVVARPGYPFKGAMIRMDSSSTFVLTPLVHAQTVGEGCENDAQAVSHVNSDYKTAMSAEWSAEPGTYFMDVTVVEYNNSTGSVYWYSHVNINVEGGGDEASPSTTVTTPQSRAPVSAKSPTGSPVTTSQPKQTTFPTYTEKCYVCGGYPQAIIGQPDNEVLLNNEVATCRDLENWGRDGLLPPSICEAAQDAAEGACGCRYSVFGPTKSPAPTWTPAPHYAERCDVCGAGHHVSKYQHIVSFDGGVGTCGKLEHEGKYGFLSPKVCPHAQKVAEQECECRCTVCPDGWVTNLSAEVVIKNEIATCQELQQILNLNPIEPDVCQNAQETAALACGCTGGSTLSPSVTPVPTGSPGPTYSEECHVCKTPDARVTKLDASVVVDGLALSCLELQTVGIEGLIPPVFCDEAQDQASRLCGCDDSAPTLSPTVTGGPTHTATPTYSEKCHVCGEHRTVANPLHSMTFDGVTVTCEELEEAGAIGILPPQLCYDASERVQSVCGCIDKPETGSTFTPTVTPLPSSSPYPTYTEKCIVCGTGKIVQNPEGQVMFDNFWDTCGAVEQDGLNGYIPPELCDKAKASIQESCHCIVQPPTEAPVNTFAPTVTAEPTVTSSPTFAEKCAICGKGGKVSKPLASVTVSGFKISCGELEKDGLNGLLPPDLCLYSRIEAEQYCGCVLAPAPSPSLHTFYPTITAEPTITSSPTFSETCNVCIGESLHVTKPDAGITIGELIVSCGEIEKLALARAIDPGLCHNVQQQVVSKCACSVAPQQTNVSPWMAPTPIQKVHPTVVQTGDTMIQKSFPNGKDSSAPKQRKSLSIALAWGAFLALSLELLGWTL